MKYTRYNIKPKKKSSNLLYLIIVMLIALVLTVMFFNKFYYKDDLKKNNGSTNEIKKEEKKEAVKDTEENIKSSNFILIQCGVFKVKDNADKVKNQLSSFGSPFLVQQDNTYKVYQGIYTEEDCDKVIEKLNKNKIQNTKIVITLPYEDLSVVELSKIIDAELKIINKTSDAQVKSIKTNELKKWVSSLENLNEDTSLYKDVKEMKDYIASLPEEVDKKKSEEMNIYIYNKLIKFKNN
ncbi:MAG: SPOR domain-containing protein [Clostridium argentinense]|uniref:SPOR domain-containing protein n=1 Tax=Clostridium faecium TaxID=2762223 RepID=A0ABR8YV13_9CLOT|nr:SPOR domain-containing protein [Clostridium faecium]MBD8048080.1 SPOR domain-containing protein [Clostridium faecium]MBS5824704.1 SPOR domain-containing protein [Clostridium argentinense]